MPSKFRRRAAGYFVRNYKSNRIFVLNDPQAPRVCPALAAEIGLNESILFLQWEFWLVTEGVDRDGYRWLRRTVREVVDFFPFWSRATAQRVIESLLEKKLFVAGDFDEGPGRPGRWMRFDFDQVALLNSVRLLSHSETTKAQTETNSAQIETPVNIGNKRKKKREVKPEDLIVPFNSTEFAEALDLFETQREQKRAGKFTDVARMLLYRQLKAWGEPRSIAALLHSARNGYTGCFEPKTYETSSSSATSGRQSDGANGNSKYDPFADKLVV